MAHRQEILATLEGGRWHTARDIAKRIGITYDLCRAELHDLMKQGAPLERTSAKVKLPHALRGSYYFRRTDIDKE